MDYLKRNYETLIEIKSKYMTLKRSCISLTQIRESIELALLEYGTIKGKN